VRGHPVLLGTAVALIAFNLRPAVAAVGPVLPEIRADLHLSGIEAALLTTLPVLCFGVLAAVAPRLARRAGIEPVLMGAVLVLLAAQLVRVLDGPSLLFAGTFFVGAAIATANVMLPPLIKRDFPTRTGLMMGIYSMTLSGSAAIGAGATVPLGDLLGLGWPGALAVWTIPAALAAVAWLPRTRAHTPPSTPPPARSLLRDALAWQVTVYFGLQALTFYALLAWLPTIYRGYGYSAAEAGFLLSSSGLVQIPIALVLPTLLTRAANQIPHFVVATTVFAAGVAGVLLAPTSAPYLWMALLGVGGGACFAIGLTLFVLRTDRPSDTARLSAMAQSFGYVITAFGPLLAGVVFDLTGSWTAPLLLLLLLMAPQLWAGILACRQRYVSHHADQRQQGADQPG
jgi:MFS transporter, CP family, cyanate transporter